MIKIKFGDIPKEIIEVIQKLNKSDFEGYLVGGCVRDMLMNIQPKDWDITTNAKPEEIQNIFEHTFYENDFGTVGIVLDEIQKKLINLKVTYIIMVFHIIIVKHLKKLFRMKH